MLGQPADEEHRRHVIVTAELVTLGKQVATLKDIVAIVTLRVLLVVVLRLFKYRLVVVLATKVAFTPFGELAKTFGDIIQLLRQTAFVGMSLAFISLSVYQQFAKWQIKTLAVSVVLIDQFSNAVLYVLDDNLTSVALLKWIKNQSPATDKVTVVRLVGVSVSSS